MKTELAAAALTVSLLALAACGSEDGPTDERTEEGAIATLMEFSHNIGADDYAAACERIDPDMRTDTCEESLTSLRTEREREEPDWFTNVPSEDADIDAFATTGCAYYIAGRLPTDPAVMVWHDGQWWVHSVGAMDADEVAGEKLNLDDVRDYPCDE